jgi:hypothetical protein
MFQFVHRVARWYIFKQKIQIWVNFGGSFNGTCWYILSPYIHLPYIMDIWYISWLFGIFFPFWYAAAIKIWQPCCRLCSLLQTEDRRKAESKEFKQGIRISLTAQSWGNALVVCVVKYVTFWSSFQQLSPNIPCFQNLLLVK